MVGALFSPMLKYLLFLFLLLLGTAPPSVSASSRGVLERPGLTIAFDESLRTVAEQAARMYPGIVQELEDRLHLTAPSSPMLVLVKEHTLFQQMVMEQIPVIAFAVPEKNLMVVDCSKTSRDPFAMDKTMKHELTHLMVHHHISGQHIPNWLDEGLAQWASEGAGELAAARKRPLHPDRLIRMRALAIRFPSEWENHLLAYEQSESFVVFIIRRHGLDGILKVLDLLKTDEEWETAVEKGLNVSFDELEEAWIDRLRKEKGWFLLVSEYLYEILFFLAALASAYGFLKAYLRKRDYLRGKEGEDPPE
jgi:hypothetical protein